MAECGKAYGCDQMKFQGFVTHLRLAEVEVYLAVVMAYAEGFEIAQQLAGHGGRRSDGHASEGRTTIGGQQGAVAVENGIERRVGENVIDQPIGVKCDIHSPVCVIS